MIYLMLSFLLFAGCTMMNVDIPTNATIETEAQPNCINECTGSTSSTCVEDCEASVQYLVKFGNEK